MEEGIVSLLTVSESWQALIPFWAVMIPIIGAIVVFLFGKEERIRNYLFIGTTVLTFGTILLMYSPVVNGVNVGGHQYKGLYHAFSYLPGFKNISPFDMTFKVDPAGFLLAAIISFIYMVSCIYASSYMKVEGKELRYAVSSLLTLAANIGVVVAGDFFTLFLFFEGLVMFPYFMFAHREDKEAVRGANIYFYIGVATGLFLLMGMIMLYRYTGTVEIKPMAETIDRLMPGSLKYWMAALMIFGFGGKAGLFFEHFWMPSSYPVSPSPTPSMSSGGMIKAGAYGIFRVANVIFVPEHSGINMEWLSAADVGYVLIWVGVITMFLGVLNALISSNSNRMLAYHSVSQMGYIVMGIGCAAYMGSEGAMGLAGALYHIVNHSLFKVSLFLGVGAVYFRTKELDMYKLGGLWKNMPVAAIGLFIAVCGISGIPFFNGFASKTILHHAINEAYEHSKEIGSPDFSLRLAEIIFIITAAGTFASNMKLFVLTFLRKCPDKYRDVKPVPLSMRVAMSMLSFAIIFIGLFPNLLLKTVIGPALSYFNFNPASHGYHILYDIHTGGSGIAILYPGMETFSNVVHNLLGAGDAVLVGGIMFILGLKFGWFHIHISDIYTVRFYYEQVFDGFKDMCRGGASSLIEVIDRYVISVMVNTWLPLANPKSLIHKIEKMLGLDAAKEKPPWQFGATRAYLNICDISAVVDSGGIDKIVNEVANLVQGSSGLLKRVQTGFIQNYTFAMLLGVIIMISIFLFF
ncbi:MAG: complex I subunit 5 family protein [Nitrospirota bacterium]